MIWLLVILFSWFLAIQFEWAKNRYDKAQFKEELFNSTGIQATYEEKKIGGDLIHYLSQISDDHKKIVIFVHGSPGSLAAYKSYLSSKTLFENCGMISIDRPGFGYSDEGNAETSLEKQAALIAEILKDYPNLKKILVGHSMGGPVISKLAMDFPDLVDGLIMVAPSISPDLEPSNSWRKFINIVPLRWITPSALRVCNQEIIPLQLELEKMEDGWKNIFIPVTLVHGSEDGLVTVDNVSYAEEKLSNTKVKKIILKGGNHFILWSEVPLISKEILTMLDLLE